MSTATQLFFICTAAFLLILIAFLYTGSPNCPNTQIRDIPEESLVVSVQQLHRMWLPVCYHVKVTFYNMSVVTAHNLSFSGDGSVPVTSLQPGTVYNISVTPCNMAGCSKYCEIHSEQTAAVPTGGGEYGMQRHGVVMAILHSVHIVHTYTCDNENTSVILHLHVSVIISARSWRWCCWVSISHYWTTHYCCGSTGNTHCAVINNTIDTFLQKVSFHYN